MKDSLACFEMVAALTPGASTTDMVAMRSSATGGDNNLDRIRTLVSYLAGSSEGKHGLES